MRPEVVTLSSNGRMVSFVLKNLFSWQFEAPKKFDILGGSLIS